MLPAMVADLTPARAFRVALWTILTVVTVAAPAPATTVVSKSFSALCAEADMIFGATVADIRSQRVDGERGDLETLVTFTDIDPILGVSAPSLTLRFAGGVVDGVREEFLGVPRFTVGERVVLFARDGYALSPVVGLSQGYFRVLPSGDGTTVVAGDGRPVPVLDAPRAAADGGQGASEASPSLPQFLDAIRDELRAQRRRD